MEIGGLGGLKCVICERYHFVLSSFGYFKPLERFENKSSALVYGDFSNSILNSLEAVLLGDFYVQEKRIAVV